jgi:hypothetical protein
MLVYEVTAQVDPEFCEEFELYMREQHIPDVVSAGKFLEASFERSSPGRYRIRYVAESREVLETYVHDRAPALREDVRVRFPGGLDLSREEWEIIHSERTGSS